MGFFSSNLGLAEEFANPQVARTYEPDTSPQPLSTSAFSRNPFESLIQEATGGRGNTGGFNIPWTPDLGDGTSPIPPVGSPYEPRPTPTPPTTTGMMGDSSFPGDDGSLSFMDNTDYFGNQLPDLQSYLMSKEQTPPWQSYLASALIPGFGMLSTAADIGYGINPFYGSWLGDAFDAAPTFDWYEGSTDAFGHAMSDAALESQYGGYANVFEQMAAEQDDLDALMDLMEESFNFNTEVTTEPTPSVVHSIADREGGTIETTDWDGAYNFEESYSDWSDAAEVSYDDDWGGTWDDDFGWDDSDSDDGWGW